MPAEYCKTELSFGTGRRIPKPINSDDFALTENPAFINLNQNFGLE